MILQPKVSCPSNAGFLHHHLNGNITVNKFQSHSRPFMRF
ncbi:hypothetical protein ERHA54_19750 [Erwinia rhapontici]|nr:hypothetical protein ERHA54_19750 [Erwinia rhapontici]